MKMINSLSWQLTTLLGVIFITSAALAHDRIAVVPLGITVGDAIASEVVTGRTFSSKSMGKGAIGTMPDNKAVTITPETINQVIAEGYHNGLGHVVGDNDLVDANIKAGVELFGVLGNYPPVACMTTFRDNCSANCMVVFGINPDTGIKCPQLCSSLLTQLDNCL